MLRQFIILVIIQPLSSGLPNAPANKQDGEHLNASPKNILSQNFKRSTDGDHQSSSEENALPVFNSANTIATKSFTTNHDTKIENHDGQSDPEIIGKKVQVQKKKFRENDANNKQQRLANLENEEEETITMTKNELHQVIKELLHEKKALDRKITNSRRRNILYLNANDKHQKSRYSFHSHASFTPKAESRKEDYNRYIYRTFNIEQPAQPDEDFLGEEYDTFRGGSRVQSAHMNKFIDRIARRLQHYKREQVQSRTSKSDDYQTSINNYSETEPQQRKGNLVEISKYLRTQPPSFSHRRHNHKFMDFDNMVMESDQTENAKHRMLLSDDTVPRSKNLGRFLWPPSAKDGGSGKITPLQSMINAGIEASILSALQHFQQLQQHQHNFLQAQRLVENNIGGTPTNHSDKTGKVITFNFII